MPSHLKSLVRARMEKTGESYQQALRHVRAEEQRAPTALPSAERIARSRSVADTAFSIAVVRAEEGLRPEGERLFEDPFAGFFAAAGAHVLESTQRYLDLPFFRDGIRLRTRFIDDVVRDALREGIEQVVLLGAGFDARGLRMPEIASRRAKVFEIDTPEQLARKRKILSAEGIDLPAHLRHVPFDFDEADLEGSLGAELESKGFRRGAGAAFVWEGIVGYIGEDTIDASLRFMAKEGGAGSRLAFTFGFASFDRETVAERTRRAGFTACEDWSGADLWRRYWQTEPHPNAISMRVAQARV
jgi:methyltransferase (TIGR00027 family)